MVCPLSSSPELKKNTSDKVGDCKEAMMGYLKCLKLNAGNNGECRLEAKNYLGCRMDQYVQSCIHEFVRGATDNK